ncbi:MAG: ABC transporter substrate-binding protein [Chlorobiota bacterium]|jgi:1,4-dihydroxy-6-naphthoate synthase|nr:ABC transporter substrate-binding protein [Chlorobiota bacterium]QQS67645.1 MAG: ABC transporter substrate-binding protein [Chlorobiota bacterium]
MFRAAVENLIDTEGLSFIPYTNDTQSLNTVALKNQIDVTAVSVAFYPFISENYFLLDHGGSVGMNYGPVIVAKEELKLPDLYSKKIATPGEKTTAHFVTSLIIENANYTTIPITPYESIFEAIQNNSVLAGIIIHEGRLTYSKHGLYKICDIGEWWYNKYKLPLPLGANVIRKKLGKETIEKASRVLKKSIRYALDNKDEMINFLINFIHRPNEVATTELLDIYLSMYANEETYEYSSSTKLGFEKMFELMYENLFIDKKVNLEFVK